MNTIKFTFFLICFLICPAFSFSGFAQEGVFRNGSQTEWISLHGTLNTRDIGGYLTRDGMRIRKGLIFRSDRLSYLTEMDCFLLENNKNNVTPKDRIKKIQSRGLKMYKSKEIERQESLSKFNFQNAVDLFASCGIRGAEDAEAARPYLETIKKYIRLIPSL